jgi:hypothetical protein
MRLRLAPLINNPQPSPRCIGATVTGTVLTGGIAIMGTTGHTAITGITVRIGAAGMCIGRIAITGTTVLTAIMGTTIVHTAITGITVPIGAATAGIGITGAAGNT